MKYKYRKFFTFEGKRYSVYGNTMEEVYSKKAIKLRDLQDGKVEISKNMLFKDWAEQCIETYKINISDRSLDDMRLRLGKHVYPVIGSMPLKKITPMHCQKIMNAQSDMSASHIHKLNLDMKFIFEKAIRNHLLLENPMESVIKPKGTKGTRRSLTEKETEHFLRITSGTNDFILFELMYYCGCRPREAINVQRKDIDIQDGRPMLHIGGMKTVNADRYVPVPAVLYHKVEKYSPFDLLAPNKANNKHTTSSYNRLVASLRREMNISMGCKVYRNALVPPLPLADDFVPYNFRHTYCTNLAKSGIDIRTAQRLMGHSNIQITANIYTHVDMNDIMAAGDKLEQFLSAQNE